MTYATLPQTLGAPVQKLLSDSVALALEGVAASQAEGKKILESAFEFGAANAKDSLKYAEELRGRLASATTNANELIKEQVALWSELPKDPVAAAQKLITAAADGARNVLEVQAEALKSYANLVNDVWSRWEQASQTAREQYVAFAARWQAIVESAAKQS